MTNNYVIIRKTEFDASRVNSVDSDQTTALRSRWLRNADQEFLRFTNILFRSR